MNLLFIFSLLFLGYVESYKILVVFPYPYKSMNLLGEWYVKHLLRAGHEVTYVTVFPLKVKPDTNYREIDISSNLIVAEDGININGVMHDEIVQYSSIEEIQVFTLQLEVMTLENTNVLNLLKNTNEEFDAVIVDLFVGKIFGGLSALYDCPMIWGFSMGVHWLVLELIDEPLNPAYTADTSLSSNIPPFGFLQRVEELWTQIKWTFIQRFKIRSKVIEEYERIFGRLLALRGRSLPNYEKVLYNASLILCNEYSSAGNIPHTPQNFKFVGGQHIQTPTKPLPQVLQLLMDNARRGVIYFSMGSVWKSKDIPKSVTEALLRMFGALKQTVIWKYEEDLADVPKNIHIVKWAPQHSILAHPNCKIFISHGGLLSSTEAIHFGVPIIGVPVFFDQSSNVNEAVLKGYAIKVDLTFDLANDLKTAIETMLADSKYVKKVKELSMVYHDRLVPPHVELVHWVEHVIRTRGAPHLRSPALLVPWYQKAYLDLAALVLVPLICAKILIVRLIRKKEKVDVGKKMK